ncbi:hypothetical protein Vretimale_66 [Volvox reticuliferus]|uniref:FAD-binding FR-type domain-containing protein n=2 Tax=Volvox reticuliferus TaxID=1737510 RepID=A0A8J4G0A7_9CHLO|nr:hypothetical protein Vretimale_66 [Volvox reticuliferus]
MQKDTLSNTMIRRALRFAVVTAMWVLAVAGLTTFSFFYIMTPTRWFYVNATDFINWRSSLVLQYRFVNATTGKVTPLLPSTYSFILIWQWCGTLAAALGAAGLLWVYSSANKPAQPASYSSGSMNAQCQVVGCKRSSSCITWISKVAARTRRLLRWQVPPRGLWRKVLGPDGLSMLDLILLLLWFGLHILWLREMTMKTLDARRAPAAVKVSTMVKSNSSATRNNSNTTATRLTNSSSLPSPSGPSVNSSTGAFNFTNGTTAHARLRSLLDVTATTAATSNTSTFNSTKSNYTVTINATTKTSTSTSTSTKAKTTAVKPLSREVQNSMAKYTGMVGNFDLLMLFFPLPRCNFLHWLLQSDFPGMVKYHRWLGHGTLMMYSLHGVIYMALWTKDGMLSTNMQWTMNGYVNNVAGLISLIAGWILWVTSIPFIRRRFFNLFYASHIGGTVVLMLFAFMHRKDIAPWVMPGIFLYLLDVALRTLQQAFNSTSITASAAAVGPGAAATAFLSPHGNILTLTIQCDKSLSWSGLDIVFLNVPEISWWQWHPFTLATSSVAGGPETKMVLHIKTYNHWTQRLVAHLATNADPLKLYVSGPYHGAHRRWITNFDRHVFVAGGIGVTPVLGMLQDLIARRRAIAATTNSKPTGRVSLIWLSRSRDELATMPYDVLQEAYKCVYVLRAGWTAGLRHIYIHMYSCIRTSHTYM